jgi:hypothetical protein
LLKGRGRRVFNLGGADPDVGVYEEMVRDNQSAPSVYQPGAFWARINRDFSDLIWAGGLRDLRDQYFSRRFAAWDPRERIAYHCLLRLYRARLLEQDSDGFLARVSDPAEGGAGDQEVIEGRPVSLDFLQSVEEAFAIRDAWRQSGRDGYPSLIVELGAGYGRLGYVLRKMFPDATYVICDLPEALACAHSWLSRVLPGEVVPYARSRAQTKFDRQTLRSERCWILGAHQIESIADAAADAFVNIYSFAEMPPNVIEHYFSQIDRITNGVFYTKQRKREDNVEDKVVVSDDSYPLRPRWSELFRRTTTLYESFFEAAWRVPARATST